MDRFFIFLSRNKSVFKFGPEPVKPTISLALVQVYDIPYLYPVTLSAKSLTLDLTCSGRSFSMPKRGWVLRTEPCGTPEETGILSEMIG